jgi:putative transposase
VFGVPALAGLPAGESRYNYRNLNPEQQREVVEYRQQYRLPWHSPPHWEFAGEQQYFISGACYEHADIIGHTYERMTECEKEILSVCNQSASVIYAWCILPNHYHFLVKTDRLKDLLQGMWRFHGRSSFKWNGEDQVRGRKVWHSCFDRQIRSHRHFWSTVNYIHHNPVHHHYVTRWQDWPWSSASDFLKQVGRETAETIWKNYPVLDYGKTWDLNPENPARPAKAGTPNAIIRNSVL